MIYGKRGLQLFVWPRLSCFETSVSEETNLFLRQQLGIFKASISEATNLFLRQQMGMRQDFLLGCVTPGNEMQDRQTIF